MNFEYDKIYVRKWGSNDPFMIFPYKIDEENTLPEHDVTANDVDLDAYTNTAGYTVRNRQRENVATLEMSIETMTGDELHSLFEMTNNKAWLEVVFFFEPKWAFVHKKMYRQGTIKYHKYYIDKVDPNKNIYQNVDWGVVEE